MSYWIDSHAHIYDERFDNDIEELIQRCKESQVQKIILPNIDLDSLERLKELSNRFPNHCFPTVGLHPCDVKSDFQQVLEKMKAWAYKPDMFVHKKIYAIGETGLDYYWDTTFKEEQKEALRIQIQWAKELELPIILHTRSSIQDTIDIIKEEQDEKLRGVFHCFSGTIEEAEQILQIDNFYLGVNGPLTYKKSKIVEVFQSIPLNRVLLETDAPYLPPVPYRGKRNESSYIPLIAQKLADIKECDLSLIQEQTTANVEALFNLK